MTCLYFAEVHQSDCTAFSSLQVDPTCTTIFLLSHLDRRAIKSSAFLNPHACRRSLVLQPFTARESICHSMSARFESSVMSDTNEELAEKLTASSSSSSFPSSVAPQDGHGVWEHASQRTQRGRQRQRSHFHRAMCGEEISQREQHQMPSSVEQVGI